MAKLLCCGVERRAKIYWLRSQVAHFDYELLLEGFCPHCQHKILAVCGFTYEHGRYPQHRIKRKHHLNWEKRLVSDLDHIEDQEPRHPRDTRPIVFVSQYTLRISRGF